MSDNFCDIFDHGMDLELRNFVRDFLVLVANYGKSRIEKEKKNTSWICHQIHIIFVCLFVCFWGVGYVSIIVSFVIMIRNSLIQMQVINSLYIFVHPHLPVKYHCTYTWVDISSVRRMIGVPVHRNIRASALVVFWYFSGTARYAGIVMGG